MLRRFGWRPGFPERTLVAAVRALLLLTLGTPLVIGWDLIYPFVMGKALYSRALIAAAFGLWAVLALARPGWRPPRSPLLALLGVTVLVAGLAAAFGVSPQRSFWSDYGRMEGLFDLLHWAAFAVLVAAMFRTRRDWAWLLGAGLAVSVAVAAAALAQALAPGLLPLPKLRPGEQPFGTLGNPGYLGAWMQATALLAAGWCATVLLNALRAPKPPPATRAARRRQPPPDPPRPAFRRFAAGAPAAAVVALALWTLALSGSMGALAGLLAGAAVTVGLLGLSAKSRRARRAVAIGMALLALLPASLGGVLAWRAASEGGLAPLFGVQLLDRITNPRTLEISMGSRFDNWRSGVNAFAERPLLGWGTGNYLAASGRHAAPDFARYLPSKGTVNEGQDHAHNMIIEEAATKGVAGLLAYLALWGWTALTVLRAVRRASGAERVMAACVGGALAGWCVQSQTFFYFASAWLVHMLLIAWLAHREAAPAAAPGPARRRAQGLGPMRAALRGALGAGAVALSLASLAAHQGIHTGAAALHRAAAGTSDEFMEALAASIRAFEPLATHNRILLFENVAPNWEVLRSRYAEEAFRLLAWCDRAAPKALAAEPHNWQLHHALAHLYREVARTEPEYAALAARYARSAREVAPNLDPMRPMNYHADHR